MQPIENLLRERISLRRFADCPLNQGDVDWIVEGAMRAPTAGNMMLYSMILITDPIKKQVLSETCDHQPFIAKAPLVVAFLADYQRWFDYYRNSNVNAYCLERGLEFCGPDEADLLLACSDALIAAQNAVIAAESRGIGSCYIGDIMENYERHRELLNLPAWVFPVALLCFGYYPEGERPAPRSRFDRKYIAFAEQYQRFNPEGLNEMLAARAAAFTPANPYGAQNYGQWMYARKTGAPFSAEMARSVREALKNWKGDRIRMNNHVDELDEGLTNVWEPRVSEDASSVPKWWRVLEIMRKELSRPSFETWIAPLRPVHLEGELCLYCQNLFQKDWAESRYKQSLERAVLAVMPDIRGITFTLEKTVEQ